MLWSSLLNETLRRHTATKRVLPSPDGGLIHSTIWGASPVGWVEERNPTVTIARNCVMFVGTTLIAKR